MSELERIQRYIRNTKIKPEIENAYGLGGLSLLAFGQEMERDWFGTVCMIFNYGRAKGYRAANAERKAVRLCGE